MTCCSLNLVDDTFGAEILPSVVGASLKRGEWLGITMSDDSTGSVIYLNSNHTYDVAGVDVDIVLQPGQVLSQDGNLQFLVNGHSFNLPWIHSFPGATNILAARFVNSDFMVFRVVDTKTQPNAELWYFYVLDLSAGSSCSVLTKLGPFIKDTTNHNTINFCPSKNGQIAMIWYGSVINSVVGRKFWVVRTTVDTSQTAALLENEDPNARGLLGCDIQVNSKTLTVFDNARIQGAVVTKITNAPNPLNNSRDLFSNSFPNSGNLRITSHSITIGANDTSKSFNIENTGSDFLEVNSVVSNNLNVLVSQSVALPHCIWPGETIAVIVERTNNTSSNSVLTVNTSPSASPTSSGLVNIQVLQKAMTQPILSVNISPKSLGWRIGQSDPKSINITNTGNVNLSVNVLASNTNSGFEWTSIPHQTILPGKSIAPPFANIKPKSTGPDVEVIQIEVTDSLNASISGSPFTIDLKKNTSVKVPKGSLWITQLLGDAPGSDILPEGEFIEIINPTSMPLDLTGCSITHKTRAGAERELVKFNNVAFGTDSLLAPFSIAQRPLRVLTRSRAANELQDRFRYYCNKQAPVWNNEGDTATIKNEDGEIVSAWSYISHLPNDGTPAPPGTVVSPPPKRQLIATSTARVDPRNEWTGVFPGIEDGDIVRIKSVTGRVTLGGFLGLAGDSGPDGRVGDLAPEDAQGKDDQGNDLFYPLPNFPKYCLVGQVARFLSDGSFIQVVKPFFIGPSGVFTIKIPESANVTPTLIFCLGVNDWLLNDNGGFFLCDMEFFK